MTKNARIREGLINGNIRTYGYITVRLSYEELVELIDLAERDERPDRRGTLLDSLTGTRMQLVNARDAVGRPLDING